ncbi:hypothetical protein BWQ96_04576 [Gracilariopsis chorda]|uniref:Uncharacterized protein n=1 Tax=Gracilariopsis chorda TaxID=448386 RepID=A0A2V3IU82_9FLOR|nr:hypothetical protein BWQ96_04576 [Gracilariopsis chorda]|eukprot:PXF45672.1 hypothetical protein BWQ96_04576 [Gracilariopsis chorda]
MSPSLSPSSSHSSSPLTTNLATSFVTAWFCTIAEDRALLPQSAFNPVSFGLGKIPALVQPDWKQCNLQHYGLYTWLASASDGRITNHHITRLSLFSDGKLIELYQLKFETHLSAFRPDLVKEQAECMLRTLRLCIATMPDSDHSLDARIQVFDRFSKHATQLPQNGTLKEIGFLDLAPRRISALVWYL